VAMQNNRRQKQLNGEQTNERLKINQLIKYKFDARSV